MGQEPTEDPKEGLQDEDKSKLQKFFKTNFSEHLMMTKTVLEMLRDEINGFSIHREEYEGDDLVPLDMVVAYNSSRNGARTSMVWQALEMGATEIWGGRRARLDLGDKQRFLALGLAYRLKTPEEYY